jgi:hypothetical protein
MGAFDWVFGTPDYEAFKKGYDDRSVRGTDMYWGPIGHKWYSRPAATWQIENLNVPGVPMPFGVEGALLPMLYPEVKKAGELLAPFCGNALYWDPRNGKWLKAFEKTAAPPPSRPLPSCVGEMKRQLEQRDGLYRDGTLLEEEWRSQREQVIQDCLGRAEA